MNELIRFLEEVPDVMLKLVFSFLFFTSKIPRGLADFQISMTIGRKILPPFHFYALRHLEHILSPVFLKVFLQKNRQ